METATLPLVGGEEPGAVVGGGLGWEWEGAGGNLVAGTVLASSSSHNQSPRPVGLTRPQQRETQRERDTDNVRGLYMVNYLKGIYKMFGEETEVIYIETSSTTTHLHYIHKILRNQHSEK